MNEVQLLVTPQAGGNRILLDSPSIPIELNISYWDAAKPFSTRSPHTLSFVLPFSRANDKFFSFYFNANATDGTFDATVRTEAVIYADDLLMMEGVLQLHAVKDGYEVGVLEKIAKVFDVVKGMTFPQLFTTDAGTIDTDLDHALNWTNVKLSWNTSFDITTGSVGAGTIVYPLADSGAGLGYNSQTAGTGLGFYYNQGFNGSGVVDYGMNDQTLSVLNMKPAIRIAYVLEYIFKRAGYTIQSNWLQSADAQKIYMFLALDRFRATGRVTYGFRVGISQDLLLQPGDSSVWHNVSFTNESTSPFYDPDGLIQNGLFQAPYDGVFNVATTYVTNTTTGTAGQGYYFYVRALINGNAIVNDQTGIGSNQVETVHNHTFSLQLQANDQVTFYVAHTNASNAVTVKALGTNASTNINLESFGSSNQFVDVSENFPSVSVDKWLKAIIERFNLVIVSKLDSPTVVQIEPWVDWWAESNDLIDWTEIVDQDSIKIEPTTKLQKQSYIFSDAEGSDFLNSWWQHNFGWVKGKYTYLNTNDFATGTSKTEEIFQPLRNRQLFSNVANTNPTVVPNVLLPCFWSWHDGSESSMYAKEFTSCKPVLAYYNGLQSIGNGATFVFGGTNYTTYPYFSEYNEVGVSLSTKSLNWGYDWPDNFNAPFISGLTSVGNTLDYAFYTYWSQMFNEIYSQEARIMTCRINLNYSELYNLKFNDNLYLDGTVWRVLSISNYAVGSNDLANAVLLKVINKPNGRISNECKSKPGSFNTDGTVNFVNADGAGVAATEPCCTLHGYVWDETKAVCFWRPPDGGGGGGGGGNGDGGVGGDSSNPGKNNESGQPNAVDQSFPRSINSTPFAQKGIVGSTNEVQLTAVTIGSAARPAVNVSQQQQFQVPLDTIVYVQLDAVFVETGGSAGTIGKANTSQIQGTIANTRTGPSQKAITRTVGNTLLVAENKDTGVSSSIDIVKLQSSDGDSSFYRIECTGPANVNGNWFINMKTTSMQMSGTTDTVARAIWYNLDPSVVETGNLNPAETMYYNLPL